MGEIIIKVPGDVKEVFSTIDEALVKLQEFKDIENQKEALEFKSLSSRDYHEFISFYLESLERLLSHLILETYDSYLRRLNQLLESKEEMRINDFVLLEENGKELFLKSFLQEIPSKRIESFLEDIRKVKHLLFEDEGRSPDKDLGPDLGI